MVSKGLRRMFEMQWQYDEVCERAARFKDEESHIQDLQRRLQEQRIEQSPGELVSKEMLRRK